MKRKEVKLGHNVKCALTGFAGIAERIMERHNGNVMVAVQPKCGPKTPVGTMPEGMNIDINLLDYVDEGIADRVTPVTANVDIQLGWEVQDIVSGLKGIATAKTTFINGCVYFDVQPKIATGDDKTAIPPVSFVEHSRLKKVSNGIAKAIVVAPIAETTGLRPGGPMNRMRRV